MISASVIKAATAAFAQLDTSGEDAQIAELEQRIAERQRALDTANERVSILHGEILNYRGPSGREIADALIAASSASAAALASPDLDALKTERTNLQAAIGELNRDITDLRAAIQTAQGAAHARAVKTAQPLLDEMMATARAHGEAVLAIHAGVTSIARAVSRHRLQEEEPLKAAVDGLMGQWGLLTFRRSHPVPGEIIDALRALNLKGSALRGGIVEEVGHG